MKMILGLISVIEIRTVYAIRGSCEDFLDTRKRYAFLYGAISTLLLDISLRFLHIQPGKALLGAADVDALDGV